jgi:hypothetical protein
MMTTVPRAILPPQIWQMRLDWRGETFDRLNVDDQTQARFAEVFLPHLVDAFVLDRSLWHATCPLWVKS